MLCISTAIIASLVFASTATATPVPRGACNPVLAGSGLSIVNGNLEVGYTSSTANAVLITQPFSLAPEFVAVQAATVNGGFNLKDVNQDNHAAGLYPTWVSANGTIELETLVEPEDGKQGWGFICLNCPGFTGSNNPVATSCNIRNGWTGQCLQIGSVAGDQVIVANCNDLESGPQYFDIYI